jgi:hypothetical protein
MFCGFMNTLIHPEKIEETILRNTLDLPIEQRLA